MHVAVCIVGYRNAGDVLRCLAALGRSSHTSFEATLCEHGGDDAHATLAAALSETLPGGQRVTLLPAAGNAGFAGGINRCMAARADADAWWLLNPDTEPEPEALAALADRLAAGDVDAAGGILLLPDGRVQAYGGSWRGWLARAVSIGRDEALRAPPPARAEIEPRLSYLLGASMLVGRRFRDIAGLMREDYFLYCEEIEWQVRARARGLRLGFAPDARVRHLQGSTTGSGVAARERPRLPIYLDERNKLLVVRDTTPARLPVAIPAALVLLLLRFARRGAWRQCGWAVAGWWAGVLGRRGQAG